MLSTWRTALSIVFSKRKYALLFAALLLILLPIYAILTGVYVLSYMGFSLNLKTFEAAMVPLVAFLAALGFTIAAFQLKEIPSQSHWPKAGLIGSVLGTFSSACAICQPIWLVGLGLGSVAAILADYSAHILIASILLLLYAIHTGLASVAECCSAPRRKKRR